MTLFRVEHNKHNPYTAINTTISEDTRLSYKAKGIWLYAFSRPDDWTFYLNDLINRSSDGRDAVRAGLKELEAAGYLYRSQRRNADGTMGSVDWVFYETSQIISPQTENPTTVNATSENRPLPNKNPIPNIKDNNSPPPNPPPDQPSCSSFVKEIIRSLPITDAEKHSINAEFHDLSDAVFEDAITAYKEFAAKTPPDSHCALIRSALRGRWQSRSKKAIQRNSEASSAKAEREKRERIIHVMQSKQRVHGWKAGFHPASEDLVILKGKKSSEVVVRIDDGNFYDVVKKVLDESNITITSLEGK